MPLRSATRVATHRLVGRPLAAGAALALTAAGFVVTAAGPASAAGPQGPATVSCSTGCTLTASAGTTTLVASTGTTAAVTAPIWSFTADGSAPTVPVGPTLLLTEGQATTITVQNNLQAGPLALALPGMAGVPDDLAGAAQGGSTSYTFTPTRAGTYLYEAGHTANGVRQAAMGLVGAIVVQPATAEANPPQQDAVLVLGDLDPAFNANPLTADLRAYANTYRMINGRVYPRTSAITAAAGDVVRLRYVNAGMLPHSMGVLGSRQTVTAIDGQQADRAPLVADLIPAGSTEDVTVTVPSTGGLLPVADASGALDTAGRKSGGIVGFGGMMTVIDARGTGVVSTAPVVSAAVSPSITSDGKVTLTGEADAPAGAQVGAVEYTVDNGTPQAITTGAPASVLQFSAPIALTPLVAGKHTVSVRASDTSTAPVWSSTVTLSFTVDLVGPTTSSVVTSLAYTNLTSPVNLSARFDDPQGTSIAGGETFVGPFPANGNGTGLAMNATDGSFNSAAEYGSLSIPASAMSSLPDGPVTLAVHGKDAAGNWGATVDSAPVVIDRAVPALNAVTGTQSGGRVTLSGSADGTGSPVAAAEWFEGTDPGKGAGTPMTLTKTGNTAAFTGTTGVLADGTHTLSVRVKDAAGNWSAVSTVTTVIDTVAPTVSVPTATALAATVPTTIAYQLSGTGTDATSAIVAAEWYDGVAPLPGFGTPLPVTATGATSASFTGTTTGLTAGQHTLSVRVKDAAGNWSQPQSVTVTVTVDRLFANGFETGDTAWTGTGSTTIAAAHALSTRSAMERTTGLEVTGSGNSNPPRTWYQVSTSTTATSSYHAGFLFSAQSLSTGATTTGRYAQLYSLRSGTGQRVGVYYRRNGSSGAYQLTLSVAAPTNATTWTTVTGTAKDSVLLDWSGSTVTLKVNGTQIASTALSGGTASGSYVGLVTAPVTGITGTAYLDGFVANRTLPANTQPSLLP